MKITTKGQVTIPQDLRERFGFLPYTEVEIVEENKKVVLRKAKKTTGRLKKWLKRVRGSAKTKLSTNQILRITRGEG